ncbi:hypothetical protein [uncultured Fusobacterium sp.]|uniref:hypothetical protein n=1 Tax=uncultured Fusobacterium sp. TaxID=159267 RepID=UPI002622207F|nr:hypothetical protein [uncultured Fusobacterium sp.]
MLLKKIQNYIKQYVEVIANVLQCEVEIVDENLIRIAGTGYFEKNIEKKCEGLVYSFIFNLMGKKSPTSIGGAMNCLIFF